MRTKAYLFFDTAVSLTLCALIFMVPFYKAATEILCVLAILFFAAKKIAHPDFAFMRSLSHVFLLLFFLFGALSLLNSGSFLDISLRALFGKWMKFVFIFLIASDTLTDPIRVRRFIFFGLAAAWLVCIDGLYQYFTCSDWFFHRELIKHVNGIYGVTAVFIHYNLLGSYLTVAFCISLSVLLDNLKKSTLRFMFLMFGAFLIVIVLFLTSSRGAFTSLIFSIVLAAVLWGQKRRVFFALALFVGLSVFFPIGKRLFLLGSSNFDSQRFIIWKNTLPMILEHPFIGSGIGTYMQNFSKFIPQLSVRHAHNCYLQIFAEGGFFSLLSFLGFVFFVLKNAGKAYVKSRDIYLLCVFCAIVSFLTHSFFDVDLYSLQLSYMFWLYLGALVAITRYQLAKF
ncbi:MAG: hypothetical protein COX96_07390 [Candidatus Omnitrophica bacterium CG_4_10_14_0_2_um_filter_44_9]|nr:MAG: hypothetical protein COY78_03555 [Candidatus Omnitrophica bacterium CG_4_10_14_0_8_um_filter_44_12]PIZ83596.1 MAG: hypothetical protein COX96_07390 [Candidatus Omnitrophica bacterium CG_4_10_14_0_2_um_filter_44_9]